jgi:hypothetical protein
MHKPLNKRIFQNLLRAVEPPREQLPQSQVPLADKTKQHADH